MQETTTQLLYTKSLILCLEHLASCWKQEFRCYEVKIEEIEKASSRRESDPGHAPLAWATSGLPLSHDSWITTSRKVSSHSACAIRTLLRVDWKILSIRKEPGGYATEPFSTICRGLWWLVIIRLSWLSARALVVQARGVLCGCWPFTFLYFHPITYKFIY